MSTIETVSLASSFQNAYRDGMQLGQYLKEQGLTLRQFADRIGVANAGVISKYLAGRVPRPSILKVIVRETGGKVQPGDFYSTPPSQDC